MSSQAIKGQDLRLLLTGGALLEAGTRQESRDCKAQPREWAEEICSFLDPCQSCIKTL